MRLFILTSADYVTSSPILFQKVVEIIDAGATSAQLQFYIVGDHFPPSFKALYTNNDAVTLLKQHQAEKLITEVTNAIVLHFGSTLKGSKQFLHYFLPLSHPGLNRSLSLIKRIQQRFAFNQYLKNSAGVICVNDWSLGTLQQLYPKQAHRIAAVSLPTIAPIAFDWVQLSELKESLTGGNNYYLAFVPVDYFTTTLKEFSIFKKWQQTTMSIVFVFDNNSQLEAAAQLLKGYRYKEAVVLKCLSDLTPQWIAATYAILFDAVDFDKTSFIEWAVHYDVPMLFNHNQMQPESWLKAGEVFSFYEKLALSNHFKLYYKDEVYRQARARMGKEWLAALNDQMAAKDLPSLPNYFKG